jgi:hypothetical protein
MKKIADYKLIRAQSLDELETKIQKEIEDGYVPYNTPITIITNDMDKTFIKELIKDKDLQVL